MELTVRVAKSLQRRGAQVIYGKALPTAEREVLDLGILDRVAARVADRWMEELEEEAQDEAEADEADEEDDYQ